MKRCNSCAENRPLTEFHQDRNRPDGRTSSCKPCAIARAREWYAENRERAKQARKQWAANHRAQSRAIKRAWVERNKAAIRERNSAPEARLKARQRQQRYYGQHREAINARARARRAENPEQRREIARRWNRNHQSAVAAVQALRRARLASAPVVERVRVEFLAARDRNICGVCRKRVHVRERSIDHIVPISRGGDHSYLNTRLAHRRCNSARGNHGPAQQRLLS